MSAPPSLTPLAARLRGDVLADRATRVLYATDASAYREMPLGVVRPRDHADVVQLVTFAREHGLPLIPRGAGTSLGGQVVGNGIVVDMGFYLNRILEIDPEKRIARVQPGVVRDELNLALRQHGLQFAPITSTANRAMIGGMVGNNSCGQNSIVYGSTRDHLLAVQGVLSDGSTATFGELPAEELTAKRTGNSLEAAIYNQICTMLEDAEAVADIQREYPKPSIRRRNTGYAIDVMLENQPFTPDGAPFNLCRLVAGSEGTLFLSTEITLNLVPLPSPHTCVIPVHLTSIPEATRATLVARQFAPSAVELLDKTILDLAAQNIEQQRNRFFIKGDPHALLVVELHRDSEGELDAATAELEAAMRVAGFGFHFPVLKGADINKVWNLRKAGLGVLANMKGDPKPVPCIEDTAVDPVDQPAYIDDFQKILAELKLNCVYYAHIGDGEIHLRPVLDLKRGPDREMFHTVTRRVAELAKRYQGSLSGEHGDGRVRGEFLKLMVGERNYQRCIDLKRTWDPANIFNPGKIVETPRMNTSLRYDEDQPTRTFSTTLDFADDGGILRLAERCNGSGDCRKSHHIGGTMCPSYMATRNERDTTRARANILREFLSRSTKPNAFDHQEIKEVMDLCLSCKGCASECPSNVDVASLKAEFLHQYQAANGVPLRSRLIGNIAGANRIAAIWPAAGNLLMGDGIHSYAMKKLLGFATERSLPALSRVPLRRWAKRHTDDLRPAGAAKGSVLLFADEYINYNEAHIGIAAIRLLAGLGYAVGIPAHTESGRAFMSKGMLDDAKRVAENNVRALADRVSAKTPLVGIEPSCILSFRDEYPRLVRKSLRADAEAIAKHTHLIDEWLDLQAKAGAFDASAFGDAPATIKLHGHCHQKALADLGATERILSLPANATVETIPSGCCGMAGSFGYEAEHYALSMEVGELVLFPAVRQANDATLIAAPGTSCRHQIKDGTGRSALHPVEILVELLKTEMNADAMQLQGAAAVQ